MFEKLVEDGYAVTNIPREESTGKEYPNNPFFIISYQGIMFKEMHGYGVEYSIRKRELTNRKVVSLLNPTWKILAFLGLILGLIKLGIELLK